MTAIQKGEEIKPYYKCDQCQHQYSPHLSKKCPKCGNKYLEEHIDIQVVVPAINKIEVKIWNGKACGKTENKIHLWSVR